MAWTDVLESSNTWDELDFKLYVYPDYWVDGYTDDTGSQWTVTAESSNTWVVIG